jgi:endogenous inhibitor of DNA gyrase (YacG/DUF329 family)
MKSLMVACPYCKKKFAYYASDFRPFCSEKCRLIDLGQWLNESYAVPVEKLTEEEQEQLIDLLNEKSEISVTNSKRESDDE